MDEAEILQAPEDAVVWDLVYRSPAGLLGRLGSGLDRRADVVAPSMTSDPDHVEAKGTPAVIGGDVSESWIVWQGGEDSTAFVESLDLPRDLLRAVAEGVRSVSAAEWETIAGSVTPT